MTNPKRVAGLVLCCSLVLAACPAQPPEPPSDQTPGLDGGQSSDAGSPDAAAWDAGLLDGGVTEPDAGPDAEMDAGANSGFPECLGSEIEMQRSGQMPYVKVTVGSEAPNAPVWGAFVVDYATTSSWIDLKAFSPEPKPLSCMGNPSLPGALCTFKSMEFFGEWQNVFLLTANYSGLMTQPKQAGLVGTDFLSLMTLTLDYANGKMRRAGESFCTQQQLLAAGFAPLSTERFFADQLSKLRPLSDVITDGSAGNYVVSNVPTVPMTLGDVKGWVQLDTGFDDSVWRHSVNINQAYYDAIVSAAPGALVRDATLDLTLSTCVGVSEKVEGYRLAAGESLKLLSTDDEPAWAISSVAVFVKRTPAQARPCGGIGTWTVPAAQLAGSFFVEMGRLVIDPYTSMVWVPRNTPTR